MLETAISPTRQQDFPLWYQQVIQEADIAENAPVRGCMIFKPYGYAIWENIQKILDARFKKNGVQNAYFPLLIPVEFIAQEAEHIDGFAKECAVVTHSRLKKDDCGKIVPDGELSSPYVIRPTSETMIGHVVSKWIQTYRDLPLKLNQWCNVMRWEMRTRLFLRTSEFLWQEGHTIFATAEEAHEDATKMLDIYYTFVTQDLAMPGTKGQKTVEEKFPGASNTYTVEVVMQDGKILQAATSHFLGQTFSKAFKIKYSGRDGREHLTHTSSWGLSTRVIGGIIMSHADDDGLVLPPQVAPYQVVIIPVDKGDSDAVLSYCSEVQVALEALGLRVYSDMSEGSSSSKSWKWIKKGAPVRMVIGAQEVSQRNVSLFRRDLTRTEKQFCKFEELSDILKVMDAITINMAKKGTVYRETKVVKVNTLQEMENLFEQDFKGVVNVALSQTEGENFDAIAKKYSLIRSCIPLEDSSTVLIGRSY